MPSCSGVKSPQDGTGLRGVRQSHFPGLRRASPAILPAAFAGRGRRICANPAAVLRIRTCSAPDAAPRRRRHSADPTSSGTRSAAAAKCARSMSRPAVAVFSSTQQRTFRWLRMRCQWRQRGNSRRNTLNMHSCWWVNIPVSLEVRRLQTCSHDHSCKALPAFPGAVRDPNMGFGEPVPH